MARHFKQQPTETKTRTREMYQPNNIYEDVRPSKKPRRKRKGGLLSTLLIVVGVGLLAAAGVMWGQAQLRYHEVAKNNEKLAAYVTVHDEYQEDEKSDAPEVDWAGLKEVNDEVVGWLQIPGTTINYAVYQAEDNDKYLHSSATGDYLFGGQLFVDYECTKPGMVDPLTLIYGHHLLDGSMFEQIAAMDDQDRFDEIKTVWYVTEDHAYECEPLLVYCTHRDDQDVRTFTFTSNTEFRTYLTERLDRAWAKRADAAQIIAGTRHVLCLITCNYYDEFDGHGRTILVCVPKDEAAEATGAVS